MTDAAELLDRARAAYGRRDWVTARATFARADRLDANDLYALANCSWWLGDLDEALPRQQQAYQRFLDADDPQGAALVAIDLGYTLSLRGDDAQASGWLGRAQRLVEGLEECVVHGHLLYLDFEAAIERADLDAALEAARRVHTSGQRFGDPNLTALGLLGQGRVLVGRGDVAAGMALLDEAMLAAVSEELDPGWAGNIYCHLMVACHEIADLRRAGEWTEATARWCESMPGAGPFMGICRVHRAQVLGARGAWDEAQREAERVCREFGWFHVGIVAEAHYLLGELARQRGDLPAAEATFREAQRLGRDPQPGRALLRLAQGQVPAAVASIRSALSALDDRLQRARLLPAAVDVALAAGDVAGAREWADELADAARAYGTTGFTAASLHARGALLLSEDDPAGAVAVLRDALRAAQDLDVPYDTARVRQLLARAYGELGDRDAATLEEEAAEAGLAGLGVAVPVAGEGGARRAGPGGLTRRETEVLALVAAGRSNQDIAAELVLSVRTIERHLSTVYQKLGLEGRSARAAAVGLALREGILDEAGG